MEKKTTQREYFNAIKAMLQGKETQVSVEDALTFVDSRIALLDKKSDNKKPKEVSDEDKERMNAILTALKDKDGLTIADMQAEQDVLKGLSTSKMVALIKKVPEVNVYHDKKKAFYTLKPVKTDAE